MIYTLVNECLLDGSLSKDETNQTGKSGVLNSKYLDRDSSKLALEVAQSFCQSSSYFYSYLLR